MKDADTERLEIELLLEAMFRQYGYDFRNYARASLKRRVKNRMALAGLNRISDMIPLVLHDGAFFNDLLTDLSITVTDFFRDPGFYRSIREKVIPLLKTYPFIKIWHAGCATAQEVYSMAIVLHEEGFLERTTIYATDINNRSLEAAQEGIYGLDNFQRYTENYNRAGGRESFSEYFRIRYESGKVKPFLKERITFANHNLVTDSIFGEMNMIICRNVLIYFDKTLQNRVLELFGKSLCHRGLLCLGSKESIACTSVENEFEPLDASGKIFRKKTFTSMSGVGSIL